MESSKKGRPRSPRGHGDQLRDEVLAAVNRLLDKWGSDEKLTMRAVANEVGVAAPSIYLHFSDKAELVWAALADKYEQLASRMAIADKSVAADGPRERLRAQVHEYCRFALENPGHYRLMYEVRQPAPDPAKVGEHPSRLVSGSFRSVLADCVSAGYPLRLPLHQTALTLWTGLHGLVSIEHSLALDTSFATVSGVADGLIDVLVGDEAGARPSTPATSPIDTVIAAKVIDGP